MRRLLTAWLLLVLALPCVSPLLASVAGDESGVPICCRRGGGHHCLGMNLAALAGQGLQLSAPRCADFPKPATPSHATHLLLDAPAHPFVETVSLPSAIWQAEARARVALDRARRKRGPPTRLA